MSELYNGKYFDVVHANINSQLSNDICEVKDSEEVVKYKNAGNDYISLLSLAKALSNQLRFKEAISIYNTILLERPGDYKVLRLRAGKYLSTLQCSLAKRDFLSCYAYGKNNLDVTYRLGLCCYYNKEFEEAMNWFESCFPLCDDEMGIAVIYWHTICCYRTLKTPFLLNHYHKNMEVGHHMAYEKSVRVFAQTETIDNALLSLSNESDDLTYSITLYGICRYLYFTGHIRQYTLEMHHLIDRDGFWPSYAYLAAWNDFYKC